MGWMVQYVGNLEGVGNVVHLSFLLFRANRCGFMTHTKDRNGAILF